MKKWENIVLWISMLVAVAGIAALIIRGGGIVRSNR